MPANESINRPGGHFLWAERARPSAAMLNKAGQIANQALFNTFLSRLFDGRPGCVGDDLLVTDAGAGLVAVAPGLALLMDPGNDGEHGIDYRPVVVSVAATLEIDDPDEEARVDLVIARPATVDDVAITVHHPGANGLTPRQEPTRRRFSADLEVVKGAPGGTAPATPEGALPLARVTVATDGTLTIHDVRPPLTVSPRLRPVPGEDHVVEGLAPSVVGSAAVAVAGGVADFSGLRYRYAPVELTPTPNLTGSTRYDLLLAHDDGSISLLEGTDTEPTQDDAPSGSLLLGWAAIENGGATIQAVTDTRETGTIGAAQLRAGAVGDALADGSVTGAKLKDGAITTAKLHRDARDGYVLLTHEGYNAGARSHTVAVQVVDATGAPLARATVCACKVVSDPAVAGQMQLDAGAANLSPSGTSKLLFETDADGAATLTVSHPIAPITTHDVHLVVDPLGSGISGGGHLQHPVNAAP